MPIKEIKIQIDTDSTLRHKYHLTPIGVDGRSTSVIIPWEYMVKLAEQLNVSSLSEVRKRLRAVWHTAEGLDGLVLTFEDTSKGKKKGNE